MNNSTYGNMPYSNAQYTYPPGNNDSYAQQQQYQPAPPQIRNPFTPPSTTGGSSYAKQNANYDPEHEAQMAQWQSAYAPAGQIDKRGAKLDKIDNGSLTPVGAKPVSNTQVDGLDSNISIPGGGEKTKTVVRKGGGQTWEDSSLLEWDPNQFRIMVGNLAGEVTDDSLAKAFAPYGVFKARVIRDKRTTKSKGYGFVSFTDGEQGFKAAREMVGKYIGSHPVTIQRSKTDIRPVVQKDNKYRGKNNKHKKKDKNEKSEDDPLRAHTGAHIEKKPVRNLSGIKMLG